MVLVLQDSKPGSCIETVLGPDIILKIAEHLVEIGPAAIRPLLLTSRRMYSLLKTYEVSITKSVACSDRKLAYMNLEESSDSLSLILAPDRLTVHRFSYAWFAEMQCRHDTIDFLLSHEITEMMDNTGNWPTLNIPKAELASRVRLYKRRALLLMYQLSDSTVGAEGTAAIRLQQKQFLDGLPAEDLAALACIGEVFGRGYYTVIKNTLARLEYQDSLLGLPHCEPHRGIFIPKNVRTGEFESDHWINECVCVFKDKIERYGPFFGWAFLDGCSLQNSRPDIWFRHEMQVGLDDMNAFELGYTMAFASLQSVVWKAFCTKAECSTADRWKKVKEILETEMAGYQLNKTEV